MKDEMYLFSFTSENVRNENVYDCNIKLQTCRVYIQTQSLCKIALFIIIIYFYSLQRIMGELKSHLR